MISSSVHQQSKTIDQGIMYHCPNAFHEGNCKSALCDSCLGELTREYNNTTANPPIRPGDELKVRSSKRSGTVRSKFTQGHKSTTTGTTISTTEKKCVTKCKHCLDGGDEDKYLLFDLQKVMNHLKDLDPTRLKWNTMDISSSSHLTTHYLKKCAKEGKNPPIRCISCKGLWKKSLMSIVNDFEEKGVVKK